MQNYKKLIVWIKAMDLAKEIYLLTRKFPKEEKFSLTSQMRRSAVSIASNIAEGSGRSSNKEFAYFLSIARGSSFELATQIEIAEKISFLSKANSQRLSSELDEISRILFTLIKKFTAQNKDARH